MRQHESWKVTFCVLNIGGEWVGSHGCDAVFKKKFFLGGGTSLGKLCNHTKDKGTVSRGKTAVLLDFVQITSPPQFPPIWTTCSTFSNLKIQDLKVSLELQILYILYNILYIQPKKQFKV